MNLFKSRTRKRASAGFTILEVSLSAFVLIFALASSLTALQAGFREIDVARGTTIASQVIQSEIERLRMMNWSMISALPASQTFDGATFFSTNTRIAGKFMVTRTVTPNAARPADIRDITVSATWKSTDGRTHTRTFTAQYARNGLYDYYYSVARP